MKTAIIIGHQGQDGQLLYSQLLSKSYQLFGIDKTETKSTIDGLPASLDIHNPIDVKSLVGHLKPSEIYYLAAFHHSSQDKVVESPLSIFEQSFQVNTFGLLNFLEAIRTESPQSRLFYAVSGRIFGVPTEKPQNEETPVNPTCIYGITKSAGLFSCRYYRQEYGLYASSGILYNHESELRDAKFVSRKIIQAVLKIKKGEQDFLEIGDLSAKIDWGYAPEYVEAMYQILQHEQADDFIIATGELHSVQEFVEIAFSLAGLDWQQHVKENKNIIARKSLPLLGDISKVTNKLGWRPSLSFPQMVETIMQKEQQKNGY